MAYSHCMGPGRGNGHWYNRKQWAVVPVPVLDQCQHFCIIDPILESSRPGPVSCPISSPGAVQCEYIHPVEKALTSDWFMNSFITSF